MRKGFLALTLLGVLVLFPATANAQHHHQRYHDELDHRDFHRYLYHKDAHRYPMSWWQHERLHDALEHDAFHDRLEHRQYHRWNNYRWYAPNPGFGFGLQGRGFSFWFGR